MSKSDGWELALTKLVFQNISAGTIGDATGLQASSAAGSLYISLHSADPGEAGDQTTNELAYTNYARVGVARGTATWTCAKPSGKAPGSVGRMPTTRSRTAGSGSSRRPRWSGA